MFRLYLVHGGKSRQLRDIASKLNFNCPLTLRALAAAVAAAAAEERNRINENEPTWDSFKFKLEGVSN